MPSTGRVADCIVQQLAAESVGYVFGVGGANIEDLFDAAHICEGITAVLAKHEFSAGAMADGYSRAGAGLGVVAATSGGASLNLVPALAESLTSRVPVLALVGQPPTAMDGRGSFQDTSGENGSLDAERLFGTVSRFCARARRPQDLAAMLPEAIAAARAGGPAVLLLPKDVQQGSFDGAVDVPTAERRMSVVQPDLSAMAAAIKRGMLRGPVTIIVGEQVVRDDARRELEQLRRALGARIATVPDAKDVVSEPDSDPAAVLGVTGVMGHPGVARAIAGSSTCLLVGTRLPATASAGLGHLLGDVHTVSIGTALPYLPSTHFPSDDLRLGLDLLRREFLSDSLSAAEDSPAGPLERLAPPRFDGPGVRYRDAMAALDELLPDGTDIVADAGNTGAAAIHHLPARRGGRFVVALGMGGMGYSFGAGLGVAFARTARTRADSATTRRRTVVIAGDGAFFMHGMELHTALEYELPLTAVLFNNNAHAMCVTREQLFYGDCYSYNRFRPSRLGSGLAAMFPGLPCADVDSLDGLAPAMQSALAAGGPSVVSIECSPDEIPPFLPFMAGDRPEVLSSRTIG